MELFPGPQVAKRNPHFIRMLTRVLTSIKLA
jgi:hypothetical protein